MKWEIPQSTFNILKCAGFVENEIYELGRVGTNRAIFGHEYGYSVDLLKNGDFNLYIVGGLYVQGNGDGQLQALLAKLKGTGLK